MRVKADVEVLKQIPLFAGCEDAHLQVLAFSSTRVELPARTSAVQERRLGERPVSWFWRARPRYYDDLHRRRQRGGKDR